jgi:cytochrome c biogenesis protein CcmG/thiol:disulfide interchange protein DsbE
VHLLQHTNGEIVSANLGSMRRIAVVLLVVALAGCQSDEEAPSPPSPDAQRVRLLDGGREAFEAFLERQKGKPLVVNKWASWCGPCRAEFPFFGSQARKRAGEVEFVGVNSSDNDADARRFLAEYPVPFPHFKDPDLKVAASFNAVQAFPSTAFYDSRGELAYLHQGGYASEAKLAEDIDKYAR